MRISFSDVVLYSFAEFLISLACREVVLLIGKAAITIWHMWQVLQEQIGRCRPGRMHPAGTAVECYSVRTGR